MYYLRVMCCLCLKKSNASQSSISKLIDMSSRDEDGLTYFDKISSSLTRVANMIKMEEYLLCEKCCQSINMVYQFNKMCLNNIETFSSYKLILNEQSSSENFHHLSVKIDKMKNDTLIDKNIDVANYVMIENESSSPGNLIKKEKEDKESMIDEHSELDSTLSEGMTYAIDSNTNGYQKDPIISTEIALKKEPSNALTEFQSQSDPYVEMGEQIYIKTELDEPKLNECFTVNDEIAYDPLDMNSSMDITNNEFKDINNMREEKIKNSMSENNLLGEIEEDLLDKTSRQISHLAEYKSNEHGNISNLCNQVKVSLCEGEKIFSCEICGKTFHNKSVLVQHIRIHSGETPFKCNICEKSFNLKQNLATHMRIHTGERPYKCEICEKSFVQKSTLDTHMFTHTDEKLFKCHLCEKSYSLKTSLKIHMFSHTGESPYKCHICEKSFSSKKLLTPHLRIHTGEKPFKCEICEKSFVLKGRLDCHMFTHTGEKPFNCDVCEKSFSLKSALKTHMLIHTGEKPYKCHFCEKSFRQKFTLNNHILIHTGDKPFKCDICGKSFRSNSHFTIHLRIHGGEEIRPETSYA